MKRCHHRYFSLIEAVVALGLTAVLMTILAYFYRQLNEIDSASEKSLRRLYQLAYVENRLATVLPKAVAENTEKKDFLFFTSPGQEGGIFASKSPSLIFTYDNGIDLVKAFANHVVGRLYVDNQQRLVLATWPSPNRWKKTEPPPVKKEILLEGVQSFKLFFFVAPDVDRTLGKPDTPSESKARQLFTPPAGIWSEDWRFEFYQLPAIVRLELQWKDPQEGDKAPIQDVVFAYPFPNSLKTIFYTK